MIITKYRILHLDTVIENIIKLIIQINRKVHSKSFL